MLGLAVGDALGAPLEGVSPAVAAVAVAAGLEMSGGGWWAAGEWTDDTALALALAESIGERGLLDTDDLARRYIAWANTDGKGIGRTTRRALIGAADADDARARARAHHEVTRLAAGNGTVMRTTPIGLAARTLGEAADAAKLDAALTHADPVAGAASAALCAALVAVRSEGEPLAAALSCAEGHPRLAAALDAVRSGDERALARLASGAEAGACWTTLAIGIYALIAVDDYQAGVNWAVAQGGDTDTNAAVAGALLGCRHGAGAIPTHWLAPLRGHARIERAADRLASSREKPPTTRAPT